MPLSTQPISRGIIYTDYIVIGINLYKLDPEFFKKHPELYDPTSDLMANGIVRIRPPHPKAINPPKLLDSSLLGRYRELATWTDDLLSFQTDVTAAA